MKPGRVVAFFATLIGHGFTQLLYVLSHLAPRDPNLWVFGSWHGDRFADNARYLFLYCATPHVAAVRCVWISREPAIVRQLRAAGLETHSKRSLKGVWLALRAGVYVFDFRSSGITYPLSGGAVKINLWHGIPLKRIERDIEDPDHPFYRGHHGPPLTRLFWRLWAPPDYERYDLVIAPGEEPGKRFASALGVAPERVLQVGYPRNDALFGGDWTRRASSEVERSIAKALARDREAGFRIVGYLPTWRDQAMVNGVARRVPLPLDRIERVLEARRTKLYCKMHFVDVAALDGADACRQVSVLPPDIDIYQYLSQMDVLITDYSSIYFDYLLLDRPIIYYAHDLSEYQRLNRRFYYDYDQVTPGPKALTEAELVDTLDRVLADYEGAVDAWRADRLRVRNAMHRYADGASSERCFRAIRAWVGGGETTGGKGGNR